MAIYTVFTLASYIDLSSSSVSQLYNDYPPSYSSPGPAPMWTPILEVLRFLHLSLPLLG